jgi:Cys-rich four helix bundle protein (predicted Tat secretion target)
MERRELLAAAAALGLGSVARAAETPSSHATVRSSHPLFDAASDCVKTAALCQAHCIDMIERGDTSLAECLRSARALSAVCSGLAVLASQESPLLAHYASVAREQCEACERECRKHLEHPVCRDCAESCARCARECKAFTA